jgi:hypothetical protein
MFLKQTDCQDGSLSVESNDTLSEMGAYTAWQLSANATTLLSAIPFSISNSTSLRKGVLEKKIRKYILPQKWLNRKTTGNGTIRKCSSRTFQ